MKAILYINDKQVSLEDKPVDIELKKGGQVKRVTGGIWEYASFRV